MAIQEVGLRSAIGVLASEDDIVFLESYARAKGLRLIELVQCSCPGDGTLASVIVDICQRNGWVEDIVWRNLRSVGKNAAEVLSVYSKLRSRSLNLHFAEDGVDANTGDEAFYRLLKALVGLEGKAEPAKRPQREERRKVLKHFTVGFDYDLEADTLVVNEHADAVRIVFEKFMELKCPEKVARFLNENGVDTGLDYQREWDRDIVEVVLNNDAYVGVHTYQNYKVFDHHQKILDWEVFDRVQRLR